MDEMRNILPLNLRGLLRSESATAALAAIHPNAHRVVLPPSPHTSAMPAAIQSHAYNTLVVEDDVVTRHLLTQALRRRGHHVTACASAEEAIELLSTLAFPLAIVDLNLPG